MFLQATTGTKTLCQICVFGYSMSKY